MKAKTKDAKSSKAKGKFIPPWLNKEKDSKDTKSKTGKSKFVPFAKKSAKKK